MLGAVGCLRLVGLASSVYFNAPYEEKLPAPSASAVRAEEFASFSSRGNAIVVVLDSFQSDLFVEAMQSGTLDEQMPHGFVFYRNAVSPYTNTTFGLQAILTSRAVPAGVDGLEWRAEAMKTSLPARLAEKGFDVQLATFLPRFISCPIPGLR